MPQTSTRPSPLDEPSAFSDEPFFAETVTLLRSVRDHDFDTLAGLCDDDFGIVDAGPDGVPVAIRTRQEWEAWFHGLFAQLSSMNASTDSEITGFDAKVGTDLGFSVVEFVQSVELPDVRMTFDCVATIVWKRAGDGWKEARWHVSILQTHDPEPIGD